jgi:hypothetical protein
MMLMRQRTSILAIFLLATVAGCSQTAPPADTPENRLDLARALTDLEVAAGGYERTLDDGAALAGSATADALVLDLGREPTDEEAEVVEAIMRTAIAGVMTEDAWREAVVGVYAEHFTAPELAEAVDFYKSATGQKILGAGETLDDDVAATLGTMLSSSEAELSVAIDAALAERFPVLAEEGDDD